jgi:hypothetical protein
MDVSLQGWGQSELALMNASIWMDGYWIIFSLGYCPQLIKHLGLT